MIVNHRESNEDLLRAMRRQRSKAARAKYEATLLEKNQFLVDYVMQRCKYPSHWHDDLRQIGLMAVLNTIRLWDPARGVKFSTYCCRAVQLKIWRESKRVFNAEAVRFGHGFARLGFTTPDLNDIGQVVDGIEDDNLHRVDARCDAEVLLAMASPRERSFLERTTGGALLREVGEQEGIGRERVRQVCERGLSRIRSSLKREEACSGVKD